MPENEVSVNVRDLANALKAVIPHVLPKATGPITEGLTCIKLQVVKGQLAAIATDKHTLGCYRLPTEGKAKIDHPFVTYLKLAHAKVLEKQLRLAHRIFNVTLRVDTDERLYVSLDTGGKIGSFKASYPVPSVVFPDWELILVNLVDRQLRDGEFHPDKLAYQAGYLSRFLRALGSPTDELTFYTGPSTGPGQMKASLVSAPNFIGAIVPVLRPKLAHHAWVPGYVAAIEAPPLAAAPA